MIKDQTNCFKIDFVSFPSITSTNFLLRSFLTPVILVASNAGFQLKET